MDVQILQAIAIMQRQIEALEANENARATPYGIRLPVQTAAPASPIDGDIAYADGTGWNPGAGEGFYGYENGAWVKL